MKRTDISGDTDTADIADAANTAEQAAKTGNAEDSALAAAKKAYDASCKRLLADRSVLARILKGSLQEYLDFDAGVIAESCIERETQIGTVPVLPDSGRADLNGNFGTSHSPEERRQNDSAQPEDRARSVRGNSNEDVSRTEGSIFYDIRFLASVPEENRTKRLMIDVEAQNKFYPGYPLIMRAMYYSSRMISSSTERSLKNRITKRSGRSAPYGCVCILRSTGKIRSQDIRCRKNMYTGQ